MTGKPQIIVMPSTDNAITVKGMSEGNERLLPTLGIRTFNHSFEIVVIDLAGDLVHTIVVRQNGEVEVDK